MVNETVLSAKLDQLTRLVLGVLQHQQRTDTLMHLQAKTLIAQRRARGILQSIHDAEFTVYSQFGDDGIIQYLVDNIAIPETSKCFVEFGVENYTQSNTRFLLFNNNWTGLVMDGSPQNVAYIQQDVLLNWRHHITAQAAFITRENINDLIRQGGINGEIGLLSVDIDGNDYWVLEAIDVVKPLILVSEYNSLFGKDRALTIPYDPAFVRTNAHYSNLYFGCSLKALCHVADKKGYAFVGCNSQGINAYFVRKDALGALKTVSPEEGYVASMIRESKNQQGALTFVAGIDRLRLIQDLPLYDIQSDSTAPIKDLFASELGYA